MLNFTPPSNVDTINTNFRKKILDFQFAEESLIRDMMYNPGAKSWEDLKKSILDPDNLEEEVMTAEAELAAEDTQQDVDEYYGGYMNPIE